MFHCLQVIVLFVLALFEMLDIRLYLSEWIFIAMVLCYVLQFLCLCAVPATLLIALTDESNIGHVMRMLQSSVLLITFLRRSHQVTQYKEINSNQKPAFKSMCCIAMTSILFP